MHRFVALALSYFIVAGILLAADPAPAEKTGLKVGEKAPDFALLDQNRKEHTLSGMLKESPVALVFFRSASW